VATTFATTFYQIHFPWKLFSLMTRQKPKQIRRKLHEAQAEVESVDEPVKEREDVDEEFRA
jgi:hypothetical protein